jgi:hypothetical protein
MKLDILGERWKIKFKDKVIDEGEEVAGYCDAMARELVIWKKAGDKTHKLRVRELSRRIYHELIHAAIEEGDLRDLEWLTIDREHTIIAVVAKVLARNFPCA